MGNELESTQPHPPGHCACISQRLLELPQKPWIQTHSVQTASWRSVLFHILPNSYPEGHPYRVSNRRLAQQRPASEPILCEALSLSLRPQPIRGSSRVGSATAG